MHTLQTKIRAHSLALLVSVAAIVSQTMALGFYANEMSRQHQTVVSHRLNLANPAQHWFAHFDADGTHLKLPSGGDIAWHLVSMRADSEAISGAAVMPEADLDRIDYKRGAGVTEWYASSAVGLEQGFTLALASATRTRKITITYAVSGSLRPHQDGAVIRFQDYQGHTALSYGGLIAYDADHHSLPARLTLNRDQQLELSVSTVGARWPVVIDPVFQTLTAPTPTASDAFGTGVALDSTGSKAVIGQLLPPANNSAPAIAYLYSLVSGQWQVTSTFTCNNAGNGSVSVALSGDGNTALLAGTHAVCLYQASGGIWAASPTVVANLALVSGFGETNLAVALSADGTTALVGTPRGGPPAGGSGASIYQAVNGVWAAAPVAIASLRSLSSDGGTVVALSADGETALMVDPSAGAVPCIDPGYYSGAAYLYQAVNGVWASLPPITASFTNNSCENFGSSAALSGDGNTVLIGAPQSYNSWSGGGYVYQALGGVWSATPSPTATLVSYSYLGVSAALSEDGSIAILGGGSTAALFRSANGTWPTPPSATAIFPGNSCQFATSATLSMDGYTVLLGAPGCQPNPGSVNVYDGADVAVSRSVSPNPVTAPQQLTYSFTVTNESASVTAQSVTLTDVLPAGTDFFSASNGCTNNNGTVTCVMASLAPLATWQPSIVVNPGTALGTVNNSASVTANGYNLDTNGTANVSVTINAPPPGGGGSVDWLSLLLLGILRLSRRRDKFL